MGLDRFHIFFNPLTIGLFSDCLSVFSRKFVRKEEKKFKKERSLSLEQTTQFADFTQSNPHYDGWTPNPSLGRSDADEFLKLEIGTSLIRWIPNLKNNVGIVHNKRVGRASLGRTRKFGYLNLVDNVQCTKLYFDF